MVLHRPVALPPCRVRCRSVVSRRLLDRSMVGPARRRLPIQEYRIRRHRRLLIAIRGCQVSLSASRRVILPANSRVIPDRRRGGSTLPGLQDLLAGGTRLVLPGLATLN